MEMALEVSAFFALRNSITVCALCASKKELLRKEMSISKEEAYAQI